MSLLPVHGGNNERVTYSVTEAGEGEDGRMKSAIGIGALLMDGLGDTIRVSLTEDPEFEIDPCRHFLGKCTYAYEQISIIKLMMTS